MIEVIGCIICGRPTCAKKSFFKEGYKKQNVKDLNMLSNIIINTYHLVSYINARLTSNSPVHSVTPEHFDHE